MSFHDPWAEAVQLFFNRVAQFIFLSFLCGLAIWIAILHWYLEASWFDSVRTLWSTVIANDQLWRAMLGLCLALGCALTGWLFTWLVLRARLVGGDHYRRGGRIVRRADQD